MAFITKLKILYADIIAALGFTPENAANKGAANGYAPLDGNEKLPISNLPNTTVAAGVYGNATQAPQYTVDAQGRLTSSTNVTITPAFSNVTDKPTTLSGYGIIDAQPLDSDLTAIAALSPLADNFIVGNGTSWIQKTPEQARTSFGLGTMSLQDSNNVSINGGVLNITNGTQILGNLSMTANAITSTQASDDILITPPGIGALKIENRITLENILSFGPLDPQGSYMAVNAEYLQSGPLSAWQYLQNGTAIKYEFANDGALTVFTAPAGLAGDLILSWTQVFQIPNSGIIDAEYGGTGLTNANSTLAITGNASISGSNTGDQIITLTGDVTGSGTGNFATILANTTVTAGTYGNSTQSAQVAVDAKGRITTATNVTITPDFSNITNRPTTVGGYGITDGATLDGQQTLTNKTVTDSTFTIQDGVDNSKKAKFQLSDLTSSTTRTYTLPNVNGTLVTTSDVGSVKNAMLAGSIADTKLNTITTAGKVSNSATTATNANTASAIVARDASGNFSANAITASLKGNADTATLLTTGNAEFYTNNLPANNGATDTYIYVGRWTTTQTFEKLTLSIIYQDINAGDTRRVSDYKFLFCTSDGTSFATGSTGNFYAWGRGLFIGDGGALSTNGCLAVQVSNTQYDFYLLLPGGKSTGQAAYCASISSGTWEHSGTNFGVSAPTGNSYVLYLDAIVSTYSFVDFYYVNSIYGFNSTGKIAIDCPYLAGNNEGAILLNNAIANRIDYNSAGSGLPALTTRSAGTKIAFRQSLSGSTLDFAIGLSTDTMWYSVQNTSSYHRFYTGTNVACRIGNAGTSSRGAVYQGNSAITTRNATSTLTIAQILTLVIKSTPTANITFTLPTGTLTDAGVLASLETFRSFTWSVVNLAAFTITMAGGTDHTYVGNATIAANTSASFRTIKTAANTFTTYRI